jgi:hypothetical protein
MINKYTLNKSKCQTNLYLTTEVCIICHNRLDFYWFHDNVERDLLAWPRTQTDRSKLLLDRNQTLNPQEASCTEPSFINYVSGR